LLRALANARDKARHLMRHRTGWQAGRAAFAVQPPAQAMMSGSN
jgi:hypothetical protein